MPSEPLHSAFDALRARLQAELETQLASLEHMIDTRHREALADVTRAAAADAATERSLEVAAVRDEWTARLRDELSAAAAAHAAALATELARVESEKAVAVAAATPGPAPSEPAGVLLARLAGALPAIIGASSLSGALDALAAAAASEAPRVGLFLVNRPPGEADDMLEAWRPAGGDGQSEPPPADLLAAALRTRQPAASPAAEPGAGPARLVVPVVVGEETVAVLYAHGDPSSAWPEALRILGQCAAAGLTQLTTLRISQSLGLGWSASATTRDDDGSARRYARLLVSEIKLYNESAVRTGRERRDLLARLRPEIDRARRMYEERVPVSLGDRATVFQQELIQTLAEGDPALLGASA